MQISFNWLRKYVDIRISAEELAKRLTMVGLEVESIEDLSKKYELFVVGEVIDVAKHPKADKLTLCTVNVGKEVLNIVCGAPNVSSKQKVAVGLIGAQVPHNQHDPHGLPFVLTPVKIRGENSNGMICSEYELDLGDDKNGIMILDAEAIPGSSLSSYLGLDDIVFEIGITPNRPDAMSHIGIGRDVAAILNGKLTLPAVKLRESKQLARDYASVKILDTKSCPRYTSRLLFDIDVKPSPKWMQSLLSTVGIRSINNVVDITNFVLMEIGHPLHAFDYDKISGHRIIVKPGNRGEQFVTLDHKARNLNDRTLMICDSKQSIAIAGVMGGEDTEISEHTKNILLESAYFAPQGVRRTSKHLGLSTDASLRFERGTDPNVTEWAVNRAAQLIHDLCGGKVLKGTIDVYPKKIAPSTIALRTTKTNEVLGTTLTLKTICMSLEKIGIKEVASSRKKIEQSDRARFLVPTFRSDIQREIDLIEEVARIIGYDSIAPKTQTRITLPAYAPEKDWLADLRDWLIGGGYAEVITNSMQEKSVASLASKKLVEISNPISKDMAALRTSLIPGILQIIRNNIFHGIKNMRFFEFGKAYFFDPSNKAHSILDGYVEENRLILAYSGKFSKPAWDRIAKPTDLYDVRGEVQTLFGKIFLDNIKFIPYSTTKALTDVGLTVEINGVEAGEIGRVSKVHLIGFEIEEEVYVAELKLDSLFEKNRIMRAFKQLPRYPSVRRDIAFIVDENVPEKMLESEIHNAADILLKNIELFDIYRGEQIEPGKKSLAFALNFLSEDHTLVQEEIDHLMQKIVSEVSNKLNAKLRG